ncbi:MAG: glycosyltransferase [Candidatus Marinimicrobia bacterium]|nr:glycosyltransferase [Candidatus Neomarinimicrobiota bacterium]
MKQYLLQCIDSLLSSDYSGTVEIIVVDNHSFDGSAEAVEKQYPKVIVIKNQDNPGFGKAVNQVSAKANGDYFLILNPDTIVQENTLSVFVDYMEEHSDVGLIGPKIFNSDGTLQPAAKRSFPTMGVALPKLLGIAKLFPNSRWASRYNLTYLNPDETHQVDAVSGSCMFIRSELYHTLGGFDEQFFMFGEDLDLCYRVKQEGMEVHYVPQTQIIHYKGESVKSAPYDSQYAFHDAMILFFDKHFHSKFITRFAVRLGVKIRRVLSQIMGWRAQIVSVGLDAVSVLIAFSIAIPIRFADFEPVIVSKGLVPLIYVAFWLAVGMVFQLYTRYILSYSRAIISSIAGFFIAVAFTYFFKQYAFSRLVIILGAFFITFLIPGWRLIAHFLASRNKIPRVRQKQNYLFRRNALIIGANNNGIKIAKNILRRIDIDIEIVGFCDVELQNDLEALPVPFLGRIEEIESLVKTHGIRELIFSSKAMSYEDIIHIMDKTKDLHLIYRMVPQHEDVLLSKSLVEDIGDFSFVNIEYTLFHKIHKFTKRIFDVIASILLMVLFLPVLVFLAIYKGTKRHTYWGKESRRITGRTINVQNRFLQIVPLLWNVIAGNISLVGPVLIEDSQPDPNLICSPGLTGLDQIRAGKLTAEDRYLLNHYYAQHQGFTMDLEIILKTVLG